MPDESFQGMQNLAQVYTAARQARAQNPTGSRFDVAMQGIAQAQELSDPLFPLRKKTMEMNLQEMALQLSGQVTAKQMMLDDQKLYQETATDFMHRTKEEQVNYPTPAFKTPGMMQTWSNFMKLNLSTEAITTMERQKAEDALYFANGLKQLMPDERADILKVSTTDPAKAMSALTIALESKKRQATQLEEVKQAEAFAQKVALAEIAARAKVQTATINQEAIGERQKERILSNEKRDQWKLEARKMTESQFILSKSVQAAQALGQPDSTKVKEFLHKIYTEAQTEGDTVTPTPVVPRKTLKYNNKGQLISGS